MSNGTGMEIFFPSLPNLLQPVQALSHESCQSFASRFSKRKNLLRGNCHDHYPGAGSCRRRSGYHRISVQREAEAAELAARREAEAKAARARKAAELEAARKAAEERARAEAAEKARLEAERLAAEEAARKRQKKEPEAVKPAPAEPKEEPVVQEEDPRLEIFKKPVLLVSLKANNAANRKLFTDAFNLALETGRYDLYAGFLRSNLERDAVKVIKFGKFDVSWYDQSPYLMRSQ